MLGKSELPNQGVRDDDSVVTVTFTPHDAPAVSVQVKKIGEGKWMGPNPAYGGVPIVFLRDRMTGCIYPRMYGPSSVELNRYMDDAGAQRSDIPVATNEFNRELARRL